MVYQVPEACLNDAQIDDMFPVRTCISDNSIAVRESGDSPLTFTPASITDPCAQGQNMTGSGMNDAAFMVCVGVEPNIIWYEYIIHFFTGQGIFNETLLFQGQYTNRALGGYNIPIAFLLLTGFVYVVSVILLVYK